jgi:ribosome-associated protein
VVRGGGTLPGRNWEIARERRLAELVRTATVVPKRRAPTKVSKNQKHKRVEAKKARAEVKEKRGWER